MQPTRRKPKTAMQAIEMGDSHETETQYDEESKREENGESHSMEIQQRFKMKRSMKDSSGEDRAAKTPRVMHATSAADKTPRLQSIPVVRSLNDSFKDGQKGAGEASPHRSKKESKRVDHIGHSSNSSPSRDSKGKSRAGGKISPGKGRGFRPSPPILASTLVEDCVKYITNKDSIDQTPAFIESFTKVVERGVVPGSSANAMVFLGPHSYNAVKMFVDLQCLMVKTIREQYLVPIESLTTNGLVPNHPSWNFLKTNNPEGYKFIVDLLEKLNPAIGEVFG